MPLRFRNDISVEQLHCLLRLDRRSGKLFWLVRPVRCRADKIWNTRFAGKEAGAESDGYRQVYINGKPYKSHRVVFAMANGRWPEGEIDHADRSCSDNRPHLLRDATHAQNQRNSKLRKTNSSGVKGVCFDVRRDKWAAYIDAGRRIYLGRFGSLKEATAAVAEARVLHHKEFARG